MVTTATSSPATLPNTPPATPPTPPKKFLALCIEDLSAEKKATFEGIARWQTVAGVTMVVAFMALAVGAFIATGVLAPIYLPIAGLTAIILAAQLSAPVERFFSAARHARSEVSRHEALQNTYEDLKRQPVGNLQATLLAMGITWQTIPGIEVQHPERLATLNPLIARAKCLEAYMVALRKDRQIGIDASNELEAENPQVNREKIHRYRKAALEIEDELLQAKIQAAFTHAVLRKPDTDGTLSDLATVSTLTYEDRLLQNAANNVAVNPFVEFKNRIFAPISVADVKNLNVALLGERLLAAMRA